MIVGRDVVIGPGVRISADRVEIGDGCRIGRDVTIVSPDVRLGARSTLGENSTVEMNAHFRIGALCDVGRRLRAIGQGIEGGDYLWLTDDITIGGGGARGPRAFLTIGSRSALMDRCFVNIAEPVVIGSEVAFSNNVVVLTHSMWHSVLEGGTAKFAPVRVGNHVMVYVNAVIAPGVTIGDYVTVGAAALVVRDVPDRSVAVGNPARNMKATPAVPRRLTGERRDAILRELLREYALLVAAKGAHVATHSDDRLEVELHGSREIIEYDPSGGTIAVGSVCFDVAAGTMEGAATALAEDFRDFLRRRSIRVFTDRPFHALPLANLARLGARLPPSS